MDLKALAPRANESPAPFGSLIARPALLLGFALLTRWMTFGDRNLFNDDLLFVTIGQRLHEGAMLYVDIWDRKPPGLFLIYYVITGLSRQVIAYQLAGVVSVAATAEAIARIARRIADPVGSASAGILYICMMVLVGGRGGQAAVFFNLPMALAALILLRAGPALRGGQCPPSVGGAMLLAGFAIACKQTAAFEGVFFGLFALAQLARAGTPPLRLLRTALPLAFAGAAPMLACALLFGLVGHFDVFWRTMVTANTHRIYNPGHDVLTRLAAFLMLLGPAFAMALAGGFMVADRPHRPEHRFACLWLAAALVGFFAIPNLIDHYALPLLTPLSVLTAPFLGRRWIGFPLGTAYVTVILIGTNSFAFDKAARDNQKLDALLALIHAHDPDPRLFVFDGPVGLYALTGSWPPTPLIFPLHLYSQTEADVSPYPTMREVNKVLAWRPTTVVIRRKDPEEIMMNSETAGAVLAYVAHCRTRQTAPLSDMYGDQLMDVYSGCSETFELRSPEDP